MVKKAKALDPKRFQVFKQSIDGLHRKWGYVTNLTLEQTREYPFGKQTDPDGTVYVWSYSVMGLD